jgi:hypothetical protein
MFKTFLWWDLLDNMILEIFEYKKKLHLFNWLLKVLDLKLKWEKKMEKIHVKLHVFNWLLKVLDLKLKWAKKWKKFM